MDMTQAFPSKYLSANDVNEQGVVFRIQSVQFEQVDQDLSKPQKPVVYLQGQERGFVLNITNNNTLINLLGGDSNNWIGRDIILFKTFTEFKGDMVAAIRVKPEIPSVPQQPAQASVQGAQAAQPAPVAQPAPAAAPAGPAPGYQADDPLNYEV